MPWSAPPTAYHQSIRRVLLAPARTVFLGFASAAAVGTALLMLPVAHVEGEPSRLLAALFTAVSALCVTGLATVDTGTHWTAFGQLVILVLIQIGGLGVMTFASVVGLAVVRRLSLQAKLTAAAETRSSGIDNIATLVRRVVSISLTVEAVVAAILTAQLAAWYRLPFLEALWLGVFHAVSAFNNAGFSLYSDSMTGYAADPVMTLSMSAAIIIGGLGFPVIMQLRAHIRTPRRWTMHTRIVLATTAVLLLTGTVFITAMEWSNPRTLGELDWPAKLLVGLFHSVQTRTAGFNSVDIGAMDPATWLGMDVLMFIGAGPAGTAGGIKVTTFAVLFFIILTEIRGVGAVNVFGKRLSRSVHRQAISVALLAVALVVVSTLAIMVMTDFDLDRVLFEVVSAFGTVGLSTGITAALPAGAQLILVALMFIGRLGPITFAAALAFRAHHRAYQLPKERPIIG